MNNEHYSTSFRYSAQQQVFESQTPVTTGSYAISYVAIGTAFKNHEALFRTFESNRQVVSERLGRLNPNSGGVNDGFADGYDRTAQDVVVNAFLAAYRGKDAGSIRLHRDFPNIPLPNWTVTYNGLNRIPLFSEVLTSMTLRHGYNTRYSVNGYNSLIRYTETNGWPSERDVNGNFLPELQFQQISIFEQFAPLLGMDVRLVAPKTYWPAQDVVDRAHELAASSGARITLTESLDDGVRGADFVATDVWVSMGEPQEVWAERIAALAPYAVTMDVLRATGNPDVKFLHCLPAFHDLGTKVGREIHERYGLSSLEVTDEVFESPHSVVFDEAENRLHTIKAVMVATLA